MCQLPTHPSVHVQPLSRTHLSLVRELWCSTQHVQPYVSVLTEWLDLGVGVHRQDSRQPWTRDITGVWEKNGENPAVPSTVAPGNHPPHFLGGCGEGWGAAQTTEKWGESAASAGRGGGCGGERRERKKRGETSRPGKSLKRPPSERPGQPVVGPETATQASTASPPQTTPPHTRRRGEN